MKLDITKNGSDDENEKIKKIIERTLDENPEIIKKIFELTEQFKKEMKPFDKIMKKMELTNDEFNEKMKLWEPHSEKLQHYAEQIPICEGCSTGYITEIKFVYSEGKKPFTGDTPEAVIYPCQDCYVNNERLQVVCLFEIEAELESTAGGVTSTVERTLKKGFDSTAYL